MKVLIFSQHFPPETVATGRRASDLAESLAGRGHDVTVIAGLPNHPSSLQRPFCSHAAREEQTSAGYRILRVPVFRSRDPWKPKRLLTYGTYLISAAWCGVRHERPDAVIAVSPLPAGLAGLLVRLWHRAAFVYDLQDIWPESALAVQVMKQGSMLRVLKRLESVLYRFCAKVVATTDGFRGYLMNLGVPSARVTVIHNGVDWGMFAEAQPNSVLKESQPFAGRFVVGYIGNLGLAQRLDVVLDAAVLLRDEPVAFLLMGEGVDKPRLQQLARTRALENIRFLDGAPRSQVPSILAMCDALLVILRQDPLFEITIPSKLYEYMAAGKPILCSVGGEAAALISEAGAGLPVRPSDPLALAEGIRALAREPALCRQFGEAGTTWARDRFARTRVMGTYATLLEGLVTARFRMSEEVISADLKGMASRRP